MLKYDVLNYLQPSCKWYKLQSSLSIGMSGLQIISSCNIYSFMTHKNTSFNDSIELMYMSMVREDVPLIVLLRELNHDNANIMCKATCGSAGY